ncbi:hypothetical protein VP1G_06079 [Cytospora mali]|uniref:Uncharacterized protein n=1 Tax=Cytospora mali TaxID=578113 RepID=A0A194V4I1_CYTMA|nr:hypothetical protein VP1G_06079 [Valsa mali var. pyri (nom. inval.)]
MATAETWRTPPVVLRSQIVGAQLSVILTREPLGTYKAIILRSEFGSQREVLLSSESADTVHRAFELLLVRSADAVQNYITTNGFEYAPVSKKIEDIVIDADGDDNDDDGVSSVSSSEILDDDRDNKDLDDSTLSLSEVESAYESVSEDGIDGRYPRARATHTTPRAYSIRVRRRSRSPRLDDPGFPREGRQQQQQQQRGGPAPPHYHHHSHHLPHHNFPVHRRRSSPTRVPNPPVSAAVVDGPTVRHFPVVGGEPPAPPPRMMHPGGGGGGGGGCSWRHTPPGGPIPPLVMHTNTMNLRPEPAGPPRSHPFQYFSLQAQPPPPPGMKLVPPPPPPPPLQAATAAAILQRHPQAKPPININNGPSPPGLSPSQTVIAQPPPPPPPRSLSSSSSLSSASSTPTLTASPNKPPSPTATPAAIDYRLCIRSRNPNVTGPHGGMQAKQTIDQQWHEQRIILRTPPTRGHIRAAALRFVEFNPDLFSHLSIVNNSNNNNDYSPSCRSPEGFGGGVFGGQQQQHQQHQQQQQQQQQQIQLQLQHLRATLTRAVFRDGESYDLSTYAEDDLGRLCASMCAAGQGGMPLFEVTVSNVGPAGSFFTLS